MVWLISPKLGFRHLVALACFVMCADNAAAQQPFPYVAYVVHADAYIRSGPGQRYYPTQQLPQGFAVEVYRHDGAGWCAIRPPEGSFSWIAAHEVRLVENNAAEVIADRSVTRVGSLLSPTRTAVQVLLERGERVAVVPGKPADDPNWLRVISPAGEFRWIAAGDLGRQAPLEVNPPKPPTNVWSRAKGSATTATNPQLTPAPTTSEPSAFDHLVQASPQPSSSLGASPATITVDAGRVDIVAGSPADLQLAQYQDQSPGVSAPGLIDQSSTTTSLEATRPRVRLPGSSATPPSYSTAELPERLKEIELRLSQIVSEPPATWQFDSLTLEVNALLQQAESAPLRDAMRDLLERISRFQQVRDGYAQADPTSQSAEQFPVPTLGEPVDPVADLVKNVRQRVQEDFSESDAEQQDAPAAIDKPRYDAVGRLKPVVSRRENAPPYALVDDQGDVVSFLTPTPDLNLKPYVGRRIGVHGTRGFMSEFRRAHVTAGRVMPVDAPLRR